MIESFSDRAQAFPRFMRSPGTHQTRLIAIGLLLAAAAPVVAQQTYGVYLDLENISPNNVLGPSQQAGGLFVQGGFLCAVTTAQGDNCANGSGPINGYLNVIFNEPANAVPITFPGQYTTFPPTYSSAIPPNLYSVAMASNNGNDAPTAPLTWASSGNQIGFNLATSSSALGVSNPSAPDFVGTAANPVQWVFEVYDSSVSATVATAQYFAQADTCPPYVGQPLTLLNCAGQLPIITPFAQNVSFTLNSQNNVTTPTFSWSQASGFTPAAERIEIWQINGSGVASTSIANYTLTPNVTSFAVPASVLTVGQEYAVDIELLVLRNPGNSGDAANDNVWTRSRSFFDFTPETSSASLPTGTSIAIPMVSTNTVGQTTYQFNQSVQLSQATYIDPPVATGYLYQTGPTDPNFASVTPVTSIGSGVYQLYTLSNGQYVFKANINAGQTYNFGGSGVSSFEIVGIPASADVDPSNASAFITGLTFTASGTFTGTMTPLTSAAPAPSSGATDGPMPLWALCALGAGFLGIASLRLRKHAGM